MFQSFSLYCSSSEIRWYGVLDPLCDLWTVPLLETAPQSHGYTHYHLGISQHTHCPVLPLIMGRLFGKNCGLTKTTFQRKSVLCSHWHLLCREDGEIRCDVRLAINRTYSSGFWWIILTQKTEIFVHQPISVNAFGNPLYMHKVISIRYLTVWG